MSDSKINLFIGKYIRNLFRIHTELFEYPKIYIKFSLISIFLCVLHPKLIAFFLNFTLKRNKLNSKIIIYNAAHTKIYKDILQENKIYFNNLNQWTLLAIKLSTYKLLNKSRLNLFNSKDLVKPFLKFFSNLDNGSILILPHDTYPETFFLTQLCREFNLCKTVCVQHGTPARIYMHLNDLRYSLFDGFNSDILLSWDTYSSKLMKKLVENSYLPINKKLEIYSLNACPSLHGLNKKKYTYSDSNLKNLFYSNKFSLLVVEDFSYKKFKKNSYFNKFLKELSSEEFLSNFDNLIFHEKVLYKTYGNVKKMFFGLNTNRIELAYSKNDLMRNAKYLIAFCGVTTLAYELRLAGAYVVGIDCGNFGKDSFPVEIYNEYVDMSKNNFMSLIKQKIKNFYLIQQKEDIKDYKSNQNNSIFEKSILDFFSNT